MLYVRQKKCIRPTFKEAIEMNKTTLKSWQKLKSVDFVWSKRCLYAFQMATLRAKSCRRSLLLAAPHCFPGRSPGAPCLSHVVAVSTHALIKKNAGNGACFWTVSPRRHSSSTRTQLKREETCEEWTVELPPFSPPHTRPIAVWRRQLVRLSASVEESGFKRWQSNKHLLWNTLTPLG